jgi:hypothetical protein
VSSALCLTFLYLHNIGDQARLSVTISRFDLSTRNLTLYSGYELPRLNERFVYLMFFSIYTSVAYNAFQRATHRTLLHYTSVSVSQH